MVTRNRTNCCRFNRQCFGKKNTMVQQFVHLVHLLLCRKRMGMMNRSEFEKYLGHFNTRAYEDVHCYFADDIVLKFAGYEFVGKNSIRRFDRFFHDRIEKDQFKEIRCVIKE